MDIVVLHSPYHLYIYRNFFVNYHLKKEKIFLIVYPYQGINLNINDNDAAIIKKATAHKKLNNNNYQIFFDDLYKFIKDNKKISNENDILIEECFGQVNVNKLYVFTDNLPFYKKFISKANKYGIKERILIEDGIGHYLDESLKIKINNIIKTLLKYVLGYGYQGFHGYGKNKLITGHMCFNPQISRFNNKITTTPLLRDSTGARKIKMKKEIVYLSQPLSETGIIAKTDEIEVINKIYKRSISEGFRFFIKLHPRENIEKYVDFPDDIIIRSSIIAEEFIIESKSIAISPISTSIFNLVNIYNYKYSYFIYKLFKMKISTNFYEIFPIQNILNNIDELFDIIKNDENNNQLMTNVREFY